MILRRSRHQSNYSWEKRNIFLNSICANPRYCQSSCCSGRRHLCYSCVPEWVDKWNGNLELTLGFPRQSCLRQPRQAGLDADCLGNPVLLLQLLFFSFLLWTWKFSTYIEIVTPAGPWFQGRGTVHWNTVAMIPLSRTYRDCLWGELEDPQRTKKISKSSLSHEFHRASFQNPDWSLNWKLHPDDFKRKLLDKKDAPNLLEARTWVLWASCWRPVYLNT